MEAFDKEKETLPSAEIYIEEIEEMKNSKKSKFLIDLYKVASNHIFLDLQVIYFYALFIKMIGSLLLE